MFKKKKKKGNNKTNEPYQAREFDGEPVLTGEEMFDFVFEPFADGDERDEELRRIGGDKMRESGGKDVWPVTNCAAAFVYEF